MLVLRLLFASGTFEAGFVRFPVRFQKSSQGLYKGYILEDSAFIQDARVLSARDSTKDGYWLVNKETSD